ncbi:MAG: MinD/ParA family protein [Proteobacteria bacterium]|nr:MinD/ParA family protein [Pseudomonadota bacterium]MBU1738810.1 MinD/ParA family protein [Pseudomonadota bacterium]
MSRNVNLNTRAKIISISSGKGGVGKTGFAVNLALALAANGKQVLLIDGDLGLANVDIVLGLNVRHNLQETIQDGRDPSELLIEINPGFQVLPASSGVPEMANLSPAEQYSLTSSLEKLVNKFDYVLLDTAAGLGDSVLWLNTWAMHNIVIMTPDPTSLTDAYALMKVLATLHERKKFLLVINNVKSGREGNEVFANMASVLEKFLSITPSFLGNIPSDSAVTRAVREQRPFFLTTPDSGAAGAIAGIAGRLVELLPD